MKLVAIRKKAHDQGGGREQAPGVADAEVEIVALDQTA